jgi:hypothetical protein
VKKGISNLEVIFFYSSFSEEGKEILLPLREINNTRNSINIEDSNPALKFEGS